MRLSLHYVAFAGTKSQQQYRMMNHYELFTAGEETYLIAKRKKEDDPRKFVLTPDEAFHIIDREHKESLHCGINETLKRVQENYDVSRSAVEAYAAQCEPCEQKKQRKSKGIVVKPIRSSDFLSRGQVDLMDFQSLEAFGGYRYVCNYQDHFTKFCMLFPLITKRAHEVAYRLLDVFCLTGPCSILHSDNGREFANEVIQELELLWPGLIMVSGKPRHPQSQHKFFGSSSFLRFAIR